MGLLYRQLKPIILALGIAFLATWAACGGGGSLGGGGGSDAAPSGGGDSPVAVEIPAVNSVNDLTYITGPVVSGSSSSLSAKSAKSIEKTIFKDISMDSDFSGNSINACATSNLTRGLLKAGANSDMDLCVIKDYLSPHMAVNYSNGSNNAAAWVRTSNGTSYMKLRFTISRNSSGFITDFKMYICDSGNNQIQFTHQAFDETTGTVAITSKTVDGSGYTDSTAVSGQLNGDVQYTSKTVDFSSRDDQSSNVITQKGTMVQGTSSATINGFDQNEGSVSTSSSRISSAFGFPYGGDVNDPLNLADYSITNGAGELIDNGFDNTECWNSDGDVDASTCGSYLSQISTPPAITTVSAASFGTGETVSCSSISPSYTLGAQNDPFELEDSTCSGFAELDSHMDCYSLVYGDFTVGVTIGGATPSTNSESPTSVRTAPTIVLTSNYTAYKASFNKNLISISAPSPFDGNVLSDSDFTDDKWTNGTVLTLDPTLVSGRRYTLTVNTDVAGINYATIPTTLTYYLVVP